MKIDDNIIFTEQMVNKLYYLIDSNTVTEYHKSLLNNILDNYNKDKLGKLDYKIFIDLQKYYYDILKIRLAIIELNLFQTYTGTTVPTGYKFLCWNDDPRSKQLVQEVQNNGNDVTSVFIPEYTEI